jgi:AraC family transcriptional regulator
MFVLGKGKSTGNIVKSLHNNGVILSTAHYPVEECGQGMHYHENPHICFLLQGRDVERRSDLVYERKTGDVFFYFAGEEHASVSRKDVSKHTNIEFGKDFLTKYEITESQINRAVKDNLDAKFLILKMQQEMLIDDDRSYLSIQTHLLDLIDHSKRPNYDSPPRWVRILDDFLNDKWNEPISLSDVSAAAETHPVTISKYFRKYFSATLGEHLRKLKINKSIPLIKNTGMSLTEIAFHCGFADQSHFTRNFKALTGFLPREFRKI